MMAATRHDPAHVFLEKQRIEKLSLIREIVFGAQDGLLVPLGVVSSIAGAFAQNHIVIIAGVAEALAGAFSMGTGAYLASQAERQVHQSEIKKERQAIADFPKEERAEMILIFEKEGLSNQAAKVVVDKLAQSDLAFTNTMIQKELGLEPEPVSSPYKDALYIGFSYLLASIIPIFPYFLLPAQNAVVFSIILTLGALFGIGIIKAKYADLSAMKSGLQILLIGALSGIGGYMIGVYLPHLLGIK